MTFPDEGPHTTDFIEDWVKVCLPAKSKVIAEHGSTFLDDQCVQCEKAKPLLQGSIEKLLDPRIKFTQRNLDQIAWMIQAADACINNEESKRPNMDVIISILNGLDKNSTIRTKPGTPLSSNNYVSDSYPQIRQTNNDMKSHLALAMLGVSELEDDHDHLYCR